MTSPHVGLVAEAGPEAIIPLNGSAQAITLWQKAGQMLGIYNNENSVSGSSSQNNTNSTWNSAQSLANQISITPHAEGGIMTSPHVGLVDQSNIATSTTSNALNSFAGAMGPRGENGGSQSPSFLAEFARDARNEGGSTSNSSQPNITYAPVTTVNAGSNTDKKAFEEIIRRTNEDQQSNFVRWLESYNREQRRVSWG